MALYHCPRFSCLGWHHKKTKAGNCARCHGKLAVIKVISAKPTKALQRCSQPTTLTQKSAYVVGFVEAPSKFSLKSWTAKQADADDSESEFEDDSPFNVPVKGKDRKLLGHTMTPKKTLFSANYTKTGGRKNLKDHYNIERLVNTRQRVVVRLKSTPRKPNKKRLIKRVDNRVMSDKEYNTRSLEEDAQDIWAAATAGSKRAGATTIVCAIVHHEDGTLRKYAFCNLGIVPKKGRLEAESKGYHVIVTNKCHAELSALTYFAARKNLGNFPVRMGCDKPHCQECANIMHKASSGFFSTDTQVSKEVYTNYKGSQEQLQLLGLTNRPAQQLRTTSGKTVPVQFTGINQNNNNATAQSFSGGKLDDSDLLVPIEK